EATAGFVNAVERVGPSCSYVSFANGCGGTRPASRLVPRDTPRIGEAVAGTVVDLPEDLGLMGFCWNPTGAASLPPVRMPGGAPAITVDAVVSIAGHGGSAQLAFVVTDQIQLVGLRFVNQAIVLDPGANAAGAVVSDAAEGVLGRR